MPHESIRNFLICPLCLALVALAHCFAPFGAPLAAASPFDTASGFVNVSTHPDIAALRPVASAVPVQEPRGDAPPEQEPRGDAPPELVLSFVVPIPQPAAVAAAAAAPATYGDVWERIRAGFGMEDLRVKEVTETQAWYAKRPELVANILQRSRYYLYHIVEEVRKRGMPTEIALLPFVESGFNPRALSSAQALGLWQFIPETGIKYKLDQNHVYDARRDIIASTTAALDYLQFLHGLFADWHLALAAYNWGEKQVALAIERNRTKGLPTDYASLPLPRETRNYLPKLQAVKHLVTLPSKFGVTLPRIDNKPYFASVAMPPGVDLKEAVRLAGMETGEFEILNAAYIQLPQKAAPMRALIPVDKISGFFERVRDFVLNKSEPARASQAAKGGTRGKPAATDCCQR